MRSGKGKTKITAMALSLAMMCGMGATATSASAADATVDPDIKSCLDGEQPFRDVNGRTPHAADTKWMYCAGISTGFEEYDSNTYEDYLTYRGMSPVIRQDMAAFLRRVAVRQGVSDAAGWRPSTADWDRFRDVDDDTPHAEDILWLAHSGISTGWKEADGTSTFRPRESVKRQDMAAFLYRLASLGGVNVEDGKSMGFSDVTDATPHAKEVRWLGGSGISTGWRNPNGTYRFQGMSNTVRQDMSAFLHRTAGTVENRGYPTKLPTSYNGERINLTVQEEYYDEAGNKYKNPFNYELQNAWVNYKDDNWDTDKPQLHLTFKITNNSNETMSPYTVGLASFQDSVETDNDSISFYERIRPKGSVNREVILDLNSITSPIYLAVDASYGYEYTGRLSINMDTSSLMRNSKVVKVED